MIGRQFGVVPLAAAELDRGAAARVRPGRQIVERIGIQRILLEKALRVVDADRPEAVHRHILERQTIRRLAVISAADRSSGNRLRWRGLPPQPIAVPIRWSTGRPPASLPNRSTVPPSEPSASKRIARLGLRRLVPVRHLELAGAGLLHLDRVLQALAASRPAGLPESASVRMMIADVARSDLVLGIGEAFPVRRPPPSCNGPARSPAST